MMRGLQFTAWYSLSSAKSTTGNASDELNAQNIQNHLDPYADVQLGPSGRTDARHRVTVSAVWNGPWGINGVADLALPLGPAGEPHRRP